MSEFVERSRKVWFPQALPPRSPFGDVIEGVGPRGDLTERAERRVNVRVKNEMDDWQRQVLDELREERRAERLGKERERLRAALVALGDDDYPEHTVVRFTKTFPRRNPAVYTYAAIKADDRWYLTGRVGYRHERGLTWDEFTEWLVTGEPVTELVPLAPTRHVSAGATLTDAGSVDVTSDAGPRYRTGWQARGDLDEPSEAELRAAAEREPLDLWDTTEHHLPAARRRDVEDGD
jgi:hypothetical protein